MEKIKILGISGSLRNGSYNTMALKTELSFLPNYAEYEIFDLKGIPLFNADDENSLPARVVEFKNAIQRSDGLMLATPEYNHSVSGVLKNAIDWATRPEGENVFVGKPAVMLGASDGRIGTARAQMHLREILATVGVLLLSKPEVLISQAQKVFDNEGKLVDEKTKSKLQEQAKALVSWVKTVNGK